MVPDGGDEHDESPVEIVEAVEIENLQGSGAVA